MYYVQSPGNSGKSIKITPHINRPILLIWSLSGLFKNVFNIVKMLFIRISWARHGSELCSCCFNFFSLDWFVKDGLILINSKISEALLRHVICANNRVRFVNESALRVFFFLYFKCVWRLSARSRIHPSDDEWRNVTLCEFRVPIAEYVYFTSGIILGLFHPFYKHVEIVFVCASECACLHYCFLCVDVARVGVLLMLFLLL